MKSFSTSLFSPKGSTKTTKDGKNGSNLHGNDLYGTVSELPAVAMVKYGTAHSKSTSPSTSNGLHTPGSSGEHYIAVDEEDVYGEVDAALDPGKAKTNSFHQKSSLPNQICAQTSTKSSRNNLVDNRTVKPNQYINRITKPGDAVECDYGNDEDEVGRTSIAYRNNVSVSNCVDIYDGAVDVDRHMEPCRAIASGGDNIPHANNQAAASCDDIYECALDLVPSGVCYKDQNLRVGALLRSSTSATNPDIYGNTDSEANSCYEVAVAGTDGNKSGNTDSEANSCYEVAVAGTDGNKSHQNNGKGIVGPEQTIGHCSSHDNNLSTNLGHTTSSAPADLRQDQISGGTLSVHNSALRSRTCVSLTFHPDDDLYGNTQSETNSCAGVSGVCVDSQRDNDISSPFFMTAASHLDAGLYGNTQSETNSCDGVPGVCVDSQAVKSNVQYAARHQQESRIGNSGVLSQLSMSATSYPVYDVYGNAKSSCVGVGASLHGNATHGNAHRETVGLAEDIYQCLDVGPMPSPKIENGLVIPPDLNLIPPSNADVKEDGISEADCGVDKKDLFSDHYNALGPAPDSVDIYECAGDLNAYER